MALSTFTVNGLNTVPGLAIQAANSGSVSGPTRNEFHYHIVYKSSCRCWDGRPSGHNRHAPKSRRCCAPFRGGAGSRLTQWGLSRGLSPDQVASWSIQLFGHNRRGSKIGGGAVSFLGGAESPSNTVWPGPRPTSVPSSIFIHSAVWPQ